ncbi:zf-CCHC domain-containing protein [Tanacetum coccineum]
MDCETSLKNLCETFWISKMEKLENENVSLEFQVQSFHKERENIKLEYQKLFDSIKKTRNKTQGEIYELINNVNQKTYAYADVRAHNQDLLITIFELKAKLKTAEKVYGDYKPTIKNKDTGKDEVIPYEKFEETHKKMISKNDEAKMVLYNALPKKKYERIFMCKTAKDVWNSLIITHQVNKQVKDNKIDLFVQKYEEFVISDDETIDFAFARFNTIITSFKALDESFSSRNHVRKFLRALPTKWRPKVTTIKESKDLSTLPLGELIGNLKVYEVVLEKDSEASKVKKENYKSLALKARKVSSDEKEFLENKGREEGKDDRRCFKCGDPNHFISDCTKHSFNDQKAFVGGCWSESDEEDESKRDEICLMALDNNEVLFDTLYYSSSSLDSKSLQNEYNKLCKISLRIINKNKQRGLCS